MSTSKHIDLLCIVITAAALLLTILFMNGSAIGITAMADADAGSGPFTANDMRADWADSGENVTRIRLTGSGASITGNGAYVYDGDVHIVYGGNYVVTGQLTDGSLIIDADSNDKIWIQLDGVSIRCEDGAAIQVEQAEKVFLTLKDGTDNTVSSGAEYSAAAVDGGIDGVIYSRDDLTINGGGALTVTAAYRHAIVCNDDLVLTGGSIRAEAPQDGLHANDSVRIREADITIEAGDDGITVSNDSDTGYFYMESGSVTIPSCYEGIEAAEITVAGGDIDISPTDDGINANSYASSSINISGGSIRIINPTGRDADGLDSNGSIYISGGTILISLAGSGGNCALDCGTENGGVCEISGGTVIAAGGSSMAEGFDSSSAQGFIMHTASAAAGTKAELKNEAGETLLSEIIPCEFSSIIFSLPGLKIGDICTVVIGDTETEVTVDNSSAGGFGFRGGGRIGGPWTRGETLPDDFRQDGDGSGADTGVPEDGTSENQGQQMPRMRGRQTFPGTDGSIPGGEGDTALPELPAGGAGDTGDTVRPGRGFPGGEGDTALPELPAGDNGDSGGTVRPDRSFPGSDGDTALPELPADDNGDTSGTPEQDGTQPVSPNGRFSLPSDDASDGSLKTDGSVYRQKMAEPGDFTGMGGRPTDMGGMQWGRRQNQAVSAENTAADSLSPETWLLTGLSAVLLLAGLMVAWRFRH